MNFRSTTFLLLFALAANAENIRGADNPPRQRSLSILDLLPPGIIDDLVVKDLLTSEFEPVLQAVVSSQFTIGEHTISEEDLQPFSVYSDPTEESHLYKADVSDGTVFVSKDVDGKLMSAVKMSTLSGEIIQLANLSDNIFTTFSTSDLNQTKVQNIEFGPDMLAPVDGVVRSLAVMPANTKAYEENSSSSAGRKLSACTEVTVVRLSLKFDSQFCKEHGNSQDEVRAHIELIVATASSFYQVEGLCKAIEICDLEGFCNGDGSDTYRDMVSQTEAVCAAENDLLTTFTSYIRNNRPSECDNVHLLYGSEPDESEPYETATIGCAYTAQMCNRYSTGVNYFGFSTNNALQATLLAHELGHNIGSTHSPAQGPFPREFIMKPYMCDCRTFDDDSTSRINDFVASKKSDTCTRTESSPTPVSTSSPTSAPDEVSEESTFSTDVSLMGQIGTAFYESLPIKIISQDRTSVTIEVSNTWSETVISHIYTRHDNMSRDSTCHELLEVSKSDTAQYTIECMFEVPVAHVDLFVSDDSFSEVLDSAEVPLCCHPDEDDVTPTVQYTFIVQCVEQSTVDGQRKLRRSSQ
jgi:hypothetical protein